MKLGSLFDGIGGFPLAAVMNGITPVWASEIEKFPIEVTKTRFPDMKHLGDITQINGAEIEPVDIISAGSPCQDLSVAGKREGLSGARSGLFMEFIRIVREMRNATSNQYPRFIIWENVPGAFSSNGGQDFRSVLEEILEAEIPMPYSGKWVKHKKGKPIPPTAPTEIRDGTTWYWQIHWAKAGMVRGNGRSLAWRVLDAQYWGVPQRRKRIFLVADFAGQRAGEILFEREGLSRDSAESGKAREEVAAGAGNGAESTVSYTVRMREGCVGGGKGPLISVDKSLTLGCSNDQTLIAGAVSAKWAKGTGGPAGDECQNLVAFAVRTANTGANGHGIAEDKAHTLDQAQGQAVACGVVSKGNGEAWATPERHMALNAGGGQAGQGYPAVLVTRYKNNIDGLVEDDISATLRACGSATHERKIPAVAVQNYTVRRLTPLECERLQGFPDGWTDIEGASDTGRYKALGNSVAVPCVAWIMGKVKAVLLKDYRRAQPVAGATRR